MTMNTIASITVDLKAKIIYTIPTDGTFIFSWAYRDTPFSATYQWRNGELAVMTDSGWEIAGEGCADDYYPLDAMRQIVAGENPVTKFIAVIVIE